MQTHWQEQADRAMTEVMLAQFDHRPEWRQAQPPHATATVRGYRRHVGTDEQEVLNAYGEHAVELILDLGSFPSDIVPAKFDRFTINGEEYAAQAVRIVEGYGNTPLVARCYCSGG